MISSYKKLLPGDLITHHRLHLNWIPRNPPELIIAVNRLNDCVKLTLLRDNQLFIASRLLSTSYFIARIEQ